MATPANLYGEDAQAILDAALAKKREPATPTGDVNAPTGDLAAYRKHQSRRVERDTTK